MSLKSHNQAKKKERKETQKKKTILAGWASHTHAKLKQLRPVGLDIDTSRVTLISMRQLCMI
jgi:hypothetical protein